MKGEVYHGKRILSLWKFKAGTDSGRIKTHRRRWDESIKAYVAEEFTRYLRKVIDKNTNKEELIRDMGRAFVHFFQDHPQSFLLITNQKDIDIQMSKNGIQKSNYEPFQLFVEQASTVLKEWGVTEEQIPQKILELWALVNGLAGIYVMQGFHYEGDWMEMVNNIITDTGTIKNCIGFLLGQAIGIGGGGMINSIKSIPDGHGPKKI